MLRVRLLTAIVAIPLLFGLVFSAPFWVFNLVLLAFTLLSLLEFSGMAFPKSRPRVTMTTLAGMTVALSMVVDHSGAAVSLGIVVALSATLLATLAGSRDIERSVQGAGQIMLGCLYAGALLPHFIWLRALPDGEMYVFLVLASCMGSDAGGYFAGRWLGRNKLWPSVSPNKTIEGSVGALLGALVVAVVFNPAIREQLGAGQLAVLAVLVSLLAQLGDLLESMLKRAYNAKDSGSLLPGHGGVLDRTDSLVLPVVFIYYFVFWGLAGN